jgi:hypothetical protein
MQYIHDIMNPYTKTNFGNTHIKLLNPSIIENVHICNTRIVL